MPGTTALDHTSTAPSATGLVAVDGRTFPLRGAAIRARAEGGLAQTTFIQRYANPYAEPLEVLYALPLPADGSVAGYTIHLGEKIITGHIESREQARKTYQQALEAGRTAGLLEQERADTFTQSLGCLPPGAEVEVEIEVLHPLAFRAAAGGGEAQWEYRFPTVVGVRYEGAAGRVPDAGRLDANRADAAGTPVRLELDLLLADGEPARLAPESSSHRVRVEAANAAARLTLAEPAALDRDVVVRWVAAGSEVGLRLVAGSGLPGDGDRYGLLTLTPPSRPDHTFARDLTILIDASGSMAGKPIEQAKEVAAALLRSLTPGDRFELLAFSMGVEELMSGLVAASERNLGEALARLGRLQAGGGTEMASAIEHALRPLRGDSQRQVILLTDGYIGFEHEVIGKVLAGLPEGARLHTVGIGRAPNRTLTRGAARAGRGVELVVDEAKAADAAARRLLQATVAPVLTDLAIAGPAVRAVAPARPRDVLAGQPLVVALELDPRGGAVEVSGRLAGEAGRWSARVEVGPAGATACAETQLPIGALFGREAIEDEEMHLAAVAGHGEGGAEPILARIEALGLHHRITSRRTSLVAVSEDPTVDPGDPRRRVRLTVELPAEVSAEGVGLAAPMRAGLRMSQMPAWPMAAEATRLAQRAPAKSLLSRLVSPGPAGAPSPPVTLEVIARLVRVEHDLLVIELESPRDGFELPGTGDPVKIRLADGRVLGARVDMALSTRRGPHAAGLTLRLALRTADGFDWPPAAVRLEWAGTVMRIE